MKRTFLLAATFMLLSLTNALAWEATLTWIGADNSGNPIPQTGWKVYYDFDQIAAQPLTGTGAPEGDSPITLLDPYTETTVISDLPNDQVVCFGVSAINGVPADESYPLIKCGNFLGDDILIISALATGGGTISPSGPVAVAYGDNQLFTITPDQGCELDRLFHNDEDVWYLVSGNEYEILVVTEGGTLDAEFLTESGEIPTYPVYRFQNVHMSTSFLFVADENEKNSIVANYSDSWTLNGVAFYAYLTQEPGTVPVYRFQNVHMSTSFLFVADENEKNSIVANYSDSWTLNGVAFYAYPTQEPGTVPNYRFQNVHMSTSFLFVADENEKNSIVANYSDSWTLNGVAFYVPQ